MLRLQYLDIITKKVTVVDKAKDWEIRSMNWSPDNNWITYIVPENNAATRVWIYNLETREKHPVTDEWYNCGDPVFSVDGKYLFFTSNRDFNPIYSWTEWNHAYRDMTKIYLITLSKSTASPFELKNDEVKAKESKSDSISESPKEKGEKKKEEEKLNVDIDFDGIINRIVALPIKAGSYYNISPVKNSIYYMGRSSTGKENGIKLFDFETKKEIYLGDYQSFIISFDKNKMLVINQKKYAVINLPKSKIKLSDYLNLSEMKTMVDLKKEWQQIFDETWRQMRDFFYAPNMHGLDWESIHDKYAVLVPYANNRNDLNYILGEMIGELSVGHTYVSGGDKPSPERIKTGLLGAEVSKDESGYFKIDMILKGENWTNNKKSPLKEIGVNIDEGDYILEVNGKPTNETSDIYELLVGKAGKQVELTVNDKPEMEGSQKVIIKPIGDEADLYYYNWVQANIEKVNEATNGQVGYIHIPDMSAGGLNEFVKYFYPQLNKKALIIDDRGNGGGNVSPMIIERLQRELVLMGMSRNTVPGTRPRQVLVGPKVLLLDNYSASDGDLFPYQFKKLGLGTIIGVRSWGGVVGIRGSLPFIDGGSLRKPEFAPYDIDGKGWVIEGYGVDPDIWIDNDPAKEFAGEDEQLNKGIEVILEELKKYPYKDLPEIPPYPDKSK